MFSLFSGVLWAPSSGPFWRTACTRPGSYTAAICNGYVLLREREPHRSACCHGYVWLETGAGGRHAPGAACFRALLKHAACYCCRIMAAWLTAGGREISTVEAYIHQRCIMHDLIVVVPVLETSRLSCFWHSGQLQVLFLATDGLFGYITYLTVVAWPKDDLSCRFWKCYWMNSGLNKSVPTKEIGSEILSSMYCV